MRAGWLGILLLTLGACIFEKSDYQGGGHLDRGASAGTASSSAPTSAPTDDNSDPTDEAEGGKNALPPSTATATSTSTSTPVTDAAAE